MNQLYHRISLLRDQLADQKYIIVPQLVSGLNEHVETIMNLKQRTAEKQPVFQHVADKNDPTDKDYNDELRKQHVLGWNSQSPFLRQMSEQVKDVMDQLFGSYGLIQSSVSVLYSEQGCGQQDVHYDYPLDDPFNQQSFGCILFLENHSNLIIKFGEVTLVEQRFNEGDLVVFRGDCAHAGGSYEDRDNVCLHYYFDHPNTTRKPRTTYFGTPTVVKLSKSLADHRANMAERKDIRRKAANKTNEWRRKQKFQ